MADNKIEILTSNAKQVINDYVLGTDTDFQKVENAIQELAENDISLDDWKTIRIDRMITNFHIIIQTEL